MLTRALLLEGVKRDLTQKSINVQKHKEEFQFPWNPASPKQQTLDVQCPPSENWFERKGIICVTAVLQAFQDYGTVNPVKGSQENEPVEKGSFSLSSLPTEIVPQGDDEPCLCPINGPEARLKGVKSK